MTIELGHLSVEFHGQYGTAHAHPDHIRHVVALDDQLAILEGDVAWTRSGQKHPALELFKTISRFSIPAPATAVLRATASQLPHRKVSSRWKAKDRLAGSPKNISPQPIAAASDVGGSLLQSAKVMVPPSLSFVSGSVGTHSLSFSLCPTGLPRRPVSRPTPIRR